MLIITKEWMGVLKPTPFSTFGNPRHFHVGIPNRTINQFLTSRGLEFTLCNAGYENFSMEDIEDLPRMLRSDYARKTSSNMGSMTLAPNGKLYRTVSHMVKGEYNTFTCEMPLDQGEVYVIETQKQVMERVTGFIKGCGPEFDVDRVAAYVASKSFTGDTELMWFHTEKVVGALKEMYEDLEVGERPKKITDLMQFRYMPKPPKAPRKPRAAKPKVSTPKVTTKPKPKPRRAPRAKVKLAST